MLHRRLLGVDFRRERGEATAVPFPSSGGRSMYARVATFEGGDTQHIREMNENTDSRPELPDGVRRVMMLDDAQAGRRLFIAFFDSREALDAAESRFESMGDEVPEDVRGRRLSVEVYDVVADEEV
jgi:hypothetical protein